MLFTTLKINTVKNYLRSVFRYGYNIRKAFQNGFINLDEVFMVTNVMPGKNSRGSDFYEISVIIPFQPFLPFIKPPYQTLVVLSSHHSIAFITLRL